jgi:hypothetical protein
LHNIDDGQPLSSLEEALLPLYLHHRYQLEAATKSIGGVFFTYAVRAGEGTSPATVQEIVPADKQRDALTAVVSTLDPAFLEIPKRIVDLIPPPAYAHGNANTELFDRATDPTFDPISAAMTSANITVSALLDPARCARLAQQTNNLSLREVLDALNDVATKQGPIARATRTLIVTRVCELAANRETTPDVRSEASDALRRLSARLIATNDAVESAHRKGTRDDIDRFLSRPAEPWKPPVMPAIPPGPPI